MHPGVLLCPKLPPSAARDLFDSEVSVLSAGFTSHILPHCRMTQTVMSESCLKTFNPKDHAVMAQNYRWISQPNTHTHTHPPRRFPLPPLSVSFLLLLKVQWLQTTKKRPLCRDVTAGIAGREVWEGRAAVPTDEPWHSPWANAGHFYSAE